VPRPEPRPQPAPPRPAPPKPARLRPLRPGLPGPARSGQACARGARLPKHAPGRATPAPTPPRGAAGRQPHRQGFSRGVPSTSNLAHRALRRRKPPDRGDSFPSSAISRAIKLKWHAPQGVDVDKLVTVLSWELNPDGSLRPPVASADRMNDPIVLRRVYGENAIRAVELSRSVQSAATILQQLEAH
jgi:hypothetical protein